MTMIGAVTLGGLMAGGAKAQLPPPAPPNQQGEPSARGAGADLARQPGDTHVVQLPPESERARGELEVFTAVQDAGTLELLAANMALTKAESPAVRRFAQEVIQDQERWSGDLREAAETANTPLPPPPLPEQLPPEARSALTELQRTHGKQFDQQCMALVATAAETGIANLADALTGTRNVELRRLAINSIDELKSHRDQAEVLLQTLPESEPPSEQEAPAQ
jgi:putative membrane protein